jgi:hypothetical protein
MLRRSGDDGGGKGFTVNSEAVVSFCDPATPGPQAAADLSWFAVGNRPIADCWRRGKQTFNVAVTRGARLSRLPKADSSNGKLTDY